MLMLFVGGSGCSSTADPGSLDDPEALAPEALGELQQELCSATTLTSNVPSNTASIGQSVTWTAQGSCSATAQYAFNLRDLNGVYNRVQNWSSSNQWVWQTTGLPAGLYVVEVLVSDVAGTPSTHQAHISKSFTLTSTAPCTGASTTASPAKAATVGQQVTFTTATTGCPSAEYRVVHRLPNGTWVEASPYSAANASWVWDTSQGGPANAPGAHTFQIWVRSPGSTAAYQAYSSMSYTLRASSPCTGATLSISPPGRAPSGSVVNLTTAVSGCGAPTYRYIVRLTTGTWVEIQNWTSSPTAAWNTSLLPAGVYSIQAWTRAADSTATYESYASASYTLDAAPVTTTPKGLTGGSYSNSCLLKSSGVVDCWGYNVHRELGNPSTAGSYSLVPVSTGITQAVSLAGGYAHSCALLAGGRVSCWGYNLHGQLGNGTTATPTSPVLVSGITSAVSVGAGNSHSCAVLSDGSVRCWGYNSQGQLGNGVKVSSSTPVVVTGLTNVRKVAGGYYHTCALLNSGTVRCWGLGAAGQLGDGTSTTSLTPVTVSGLTGVVDLSSASGSTCALKSDRTVWCWGGNAQGNLGDGTTSTRAAPVQVPGISTAINVAVNQDHGCAVLQDNTVRCWGSNAFGQLGNGTTTSSLVPVPVSTLTTATSVAVTNNTTCAALADGTAACWGNASVGGLGNGSRVNRSTPVSVSALP
jgi:alpha-tubulin suppressor-like RCC1 family protein